MSSHSLLGPNGCEQFVVYLLKWFSVCLPCTVYPVTFIHICMQMHRRFCFFKYRWRQTIDTLQFVFFSNMLWQVVFSKRYPEQCLPFHTLLQYDLTLSGSVYIPSLNLGSLVTTERGRNDTVWLTKLGQESRAVSSLFDGIPTFGAPIYHIRWNYPEAIISLWRNPCGEALVGALVQSPS